MVFTDDSTILDPIWVITSTTVPDKSTCRHNLLSRAQDVSHTPLISQCFDVNFLDYETGQSTGMDGFNLMLPYPAGVARLVLKKGAVEPAARTVSANAPQVNILSPVGGATWAATGTYTVTWTASDLDNDPLVCERAL